jgi:hypothetical protein
MRFYTALLRHIAVVTCVNGCPKIGRGREAAVSSPVCSPDFILLYFFFLWGYLKTKVLVTIVDTREEL